MALDAAQKDKLQAWFNKHPFTACAHCSTNKWDVKEDFYAVSAVRGGAVGGVGMAMIAIVCHNCGCVRNFDAQMIGLA